MIVSRQVVAEVLSQIYEDEGELIADHVVEVARADDHPLHPAFEWDDAVAAHAHRVEQARELIRSVTIAFVTNEEASEMRVRAWQARRNTGRDGKGYVPEHEIRTDPEQRAFLLRVMQREWLNLRRRYQSQREFWDLVANDMPSDRVPDISPPYERPLAQEA